MIEKSYFMPGSVAYLSEEYDDLNKKIKIFAEVEQNCFEEVTKLKTNVREIIKRQNFAEDELERLEQYGRRMLKSMGFQWSQTRAPTKLLKKSLIL